MSCPVCTENFDDHVNERKCYNICASCGYSVCKTCSDRIQSWCPSCRGPKLSNPVFTRINNNDSMDVVPVNNMSPGSYDCRYVEPNISPPQDQIVLIVDVSGSMGGMSGEQKEAPLRIELVGHMVKIMWALCQKLKIACTLYTFSEDVDKIPLSGSTDQINRVLHNMNPSGSTRLGHALDTVFSKHGETAKYFVFTDGEPTDSPEESIKKFVNTQLHLIAFSKDVKPKLLQAVAFGPNGGEKHTISYIEDIRSLPGYMIPVFIWAVSNMKNVTLSDSDDECRKRFVQILEPQVYGSSAQYKMSDLITALRHPAPQSGYAQDLEIDTDGTPAHSRISYSFKKENWNAFGKFYLPCILHCHKYLIPGNSFDVSLKHYRTKEYEDIYNEIAGIPNSIPFVAFMAPEQDRERASQASAGLINRAVSYSDSYSSYTYSSSDDGCIGPDAQINIFYDNKSFPRTMKAIVPGDIIEGPSGEKCKIKYIICVHNLNHGNPILLYNGLTGSHPVQDIFGNWIKAKHQENAIITLLSGQGVVYDVILEDPNVGSMRVNGIGAAVVGYPVPGMVHPYWGSRRVVEDVMTCSSAGPNGGFVNVDAKEFGYTNGLVSSLFYC